MDDGDGEPISLADITRFLEDSAADSPMRATAMQQRTLGSYSTAAAPASMVCPRPNSTIHLGIDADEATKEDALVDSISMDSKGATSEDGASMSHVCRWPGCGKGFTSRWSLERHINNHQSAQPGEQEQPDSFVERRLRERLKSVQQALDKANEKLTQSARQQEHLDEELHSIRIRNVQQQVNLPERIILTPNGVPKSPNVDLMLSAG